jgi:hypothetical protein
LPLANTVSGKRAVNVAVIVRSWTRDTVQGPVPAQASPQPVKLASPASVAVSVTDDPKVYRLPQAPLAVPAVITQLMPTGLLDTIPLPLPAPATASMGG